MSAEALALKNLDQTVIPITRFNKGEASKIFQEVKESGIKVVFKNNMREGILISPEMYDHLMDLLEDQILFKEAERRLAMNEDKTISFQKMMEKFNITEEMLGDIDDEEVEFE